MTEPSKTDPSSIDMNRMLNPEEVKLVGRLWSLLDVRGTPIDDIPEEKINMKAVNELMHNLCNVGSKHELGRVELILAVRCALFDVIWQYTIASTERANQKWQQDNK